MRTAARVGVVLGALACLWAVFVLPKAHFVDPQPTILVRDRDGHYLDEIADPAFDGVGYWPVDGLPWRVIACTLALEDRRFNQHPGVDPRAIGRAIWQNARSGERVSGASTLAMQVARMQAPGPRTYGRKAVEASTALLLTGRYGRDDVLRQYLRLAPYGKGIHGIAYAARRYFDKPVGDLSWAETAFLTAIPQAPGRMDPYDREGKAAAIARARRILEVVDQQGLMAASDRALAAEELASLDIPDRDERPVLALHAILDLDRRLGDPAVRPSLGPTPIVVTSLDLGLQERVSADLRQAVSGWEEAGAGNAAVMVLDVHTGELLASVGSTGYFDRRRAGAIDYTRVARNPGSTLKPFLYAAALDRDAIGADSILDDLGRGPDAIENADDDFLGPLLPRQALANSRNVPAVDVLGRLGVDVAWGLLRDLGLHHDEHAVQDYGWGLAIGGLPVTLEQLAGAYLVLAGNGRTRPIVRWEGQAVEPSVAVFAPGTTRLVATWLSDPMARLPSFPRGGATEYPFPVAVKTGTSTDYRDAWTVAWSHDYLVAVWVGDPGNQPMKRLSGFGSAAVLARAVMLDLHRDEADGSADLGFAPPDGYEPVRICALSGERAGEACDHVVTEYFAPGSAPTRSCHAHVRVVVGGEARTFVDLPARYAAWQARVGLPRPPGSAPILTEHDAHVRITSPRPGTRLTRDLDVPADQTTLKLEAAVDPPVAQIVWYVDGNPWQVTGWPYSARWPLEPGEHRFEARVPFTDTRSPSVRIVAQ